eukprot:scaffold47423_cov71-Phaeocystis_antarctica.AAC.6
MYGTRRQLPGNGHDVLANGATQVRVRSFCLKDLLHLGVAPGKVVDLILQLDHLSLEHALVLVEVRRTHSARAAPRRRYNCTATALVSDGGLSCAWVAAARRRRGDTRTSRELRETCDLYTKQQGNCCTFDPAPLRRWFGQVLGSSVGPLVCVDVDAKRRSCAA